MLDLHLMRHTCELSNYALYAGDMRLAARVGLDLAASERAACSGNARATQCDTMGLLYQLGGEHMALAEIRKRNGLSQRQLAKVSGVSASRIADIERGERDMRNASFATAVRLGDALKLKDLRKLLEP